MKPAIELLRTADARLAAWPVICQLRPHLSEEEFLQRAAKQSAAGYELAAVTVAGQPVCVAGFRITLNLSVGRHLYVDDLVCDEAHRSQGHGEAMMDWLESYARKEGCCAIHLDSGVQRFGAHRFYIRRGMDIVYHHFAMAIET